MNQYFFWELLRKNNEELIETKKRFFKNLYPAQGGLRKVQIIVLNIMKEVHKICEANHIDYFLMGGALLGAIRHEGFIPWDDDIDIGMTRQGFLQLRNICSENNIIELVDHYNFNGLYRIPKICLKGISSDFCIDVIIFDEASSENKDDVWSKNRILRRKLMKRLKIEKKIFYRDFKRTERLEEFSWRKKRLDRVFDKYVNDCGYSFGNLLVWGIDNFNSRAYLKRRVFDKEDIFPSEILKFEDCYLNVPKEYFAFSQSEYREPYQLPLDIRKLGHFSTMDRLMSQLEALNNSIIFPLEYVEDMEEDEEI